MVRSLFAIIFATVSGLGASKILEALGLSVLGGAAADAGLAAQHQLWLLFVWGLSAFFASCLAMVIGPRWAPLGGLAAATIALGAVIALLSAPFSWWAWPLSLLAPAVGGFGAIKLLNAETAFPERPAREKIFE